MNLKEKFIKFLNLSKSKKTNILINTSFKVIISFLLCLVLYNFGKFINLIFLFSSSKKILNIKIIEKELVITLILMFIIFILLILKKKLKAKKQFDIIIYINIIIIFVAFIDIKVGTCLIVFYVLNLIINKKFLSKKYINYEINKYNEKIIFMDIYHNIFKINNSLIYQLKKMIKINNKIDLVKDQEFKQIFLKYLFNSFFFIINICNLLLCNKIFKVSKEKSVIIILFIILIFLIQLKQIQENE